MARLIRKPDKGLKRLAPLTIRYKWAFWAALAIAIIEGAALFYVLN